MEIVEGDLRKLGKATVNQKITKYSLIQIGNQIISDASVSNKLDNYLTDGLKTTQPTKLWISRNEILAVQVAGGQRYYSKTPGNIYFSVFLLAFVSLIALATDYRAGAAAISFTVLVSWYGFGRYSGVSSAGGTKL